jgi:predicted PurR-regulated permease PerM
MADPPRPLAPPAPPPASAHVPPAATPPTSALLGLAVGVVVVASLYVGREVLVPITLAALLAFVLAPAVRLLRAARLGRAPSVLIAVLAAVGVIVMLGGAIGLQVASLASDLPHYRATIVHKVGAVEGFAAKGMTMLLRSYANGVRASAPPVPVADLSGQPIVKALPVQVQEASPTPFAVAQRVLAPVVGPISTVGIIFIVAIFLLLQQEDLRDRMIRLFGSGDLHRTTAAIDDAASRLSRYFLTQLAVNAGFGVVIGGGLALIGVPSPVLWGVIATMLRFVPYVGSPIAAILPILLAAAVDPGWTMAITTAALYAVVELVVGQAVEPLLYGSSTGLSPFAVIVAAIFWSWLWGPIGLILSTPITLCLVVLGRHVQRLEFLDVLLGDRPALSPVESFYQRMLAGDPDEAQAHAETLLRDRTLSSYYDDVALRGLLLATADAERGVLDLERMDAMASAMDGLIEELASYDDIEPAEPARHDTGLDPATPERRPPQRPPPDRAVPDALLPAWRDGTPVLCVAGRGPLDETASRMLAQLLGKHGIGARVSPHSAASRAGIATLDCEGVAMICITRLFVGGTPSNLRYLVARLRRQVPGVPVLVTLCAEGEPFATDPGLRAAIGADVYVRSLRDAVQACLDTGRGTAAATPRAA